MWINRHGKYVKGCPTCFSWVGFRRINGYLFPAIGKDPAEELSGNLPDRATAWWSWEDSNLQPERYGTLRPGPRQQ
jgi:hypothetical protein